MKKTIALLALLFAVPALSADPEPRHVKVPLVPNGDSGISGFVQITQLPNGGSNVHVIARGLQPGTEYASFYYESSDCTEPADKLGDLTMNSTGTGQIEGKIDDDLDEVGSVSIRLGPDYGTLLACAKVH